MMLRLVWDVHVYRQGC